MRDDAPLAGHPAALGDLDVLAPLALERSPTPMVITDPRQADNPIVLANQAFLDLCGYPADEVIGRNCRFLQGPGSDPAAVAALAASVADQSASAVEILNYRRDGAAYWNRVHLSPVHDAAGQLVYFFAAQIDLSPQREAEALRQAENRLLREVDHRAMNALALVQAIVRLTEAEGVRPYAQAVQARVAALARAHQLLSARGWTPAPLGDIVRGETGPHAGPRLAVAGPEVLIGAQQVQPLTLALHEVTSNAVRHGGLSRPGGAVSVAWAMRDDHVRIDWIERGCPGAAPGREGFGTRMVDAILQRQLRGSVRRDWADDGLALELAFPVAPSIP